MVYQGYKPNEGVADIERRIYRSKDYDVEVRIRRIKESMENEGRFVEFTKEITK